MAYRLGVTEASVRNWEHNRTVPRLTFEQVDALIELYECSVKDLKNAFAETAKAS